MKKTYLNTLTNEEIIKRLKDGEVVKCEDSNKITYLTDGIIVSEELLFENGENVKNVIFGSRFFVNYKVDYLYFEEEEPFEINKTGVYRTRDERKAYVYEIDEETNTTYPISYVIEKEVGTLLATKQGRYNVNEEYGADIVAKWED